MRWCCSMPSAGLIFSSKVHTETCKRGLLCVSWRNQSNGFCRHCSRFTTQLSASLPLLLLLLLFPTVESQTTMACPSMILIASGTVATSVGDEFWWLVMEIKGRSSIHLQSNGRNPFLAPPWRDLPCKPSWTGCRLLSGSLQDAERRLYLCTNRCRLKRCSCDNTSRYSVYFVLQWPSSFPKHLLSSCKRWCQWGGRLTVLVHRLR